MKDLADPDFNTLVGALLRSDVAPKNFKTYVASKMTKDVS